MWSRLHRRPAPAVIVAAAGLAGAVIGWALLRVIYLLEHAADPDNTSPPWSPGWTGASFSYWLVVAFVVGGTLAATAIATLVLVAHAARATSIARDRRRREQRDHVDARGGKVEQLYAEEPQSALTLLKNVEPRTNR